MARHQFGGLVAFAVALAITSASIGLLQARAATRHALLEVGVLVAANVLATVAGSCCSGSGSPGRRRRRLAILARS